MRRLSLILLPFLAAFALVFGGFYLYAGFRVLQTGRAGAAILLMSFGVIGVGLAAAIWVARRRALARPTPTPPADESPRR
jgi:hypothetical protein